MNEGDVEPLGRPDTTLPVLLFNEYRKYKNFKHEKIRGWSVPQKKGKMLEELRELAKVDNKQKCPELVASICELDKL